MAVKDYGVYGWSDEGTSAHVAVTKNEDGEIRISVDEMRNGKMASAINLDKAQAIEIVEVMQRMIREG